MMHTTSTLPLFPNWTPARPAFRVGDRVAWRHPRLGLCVGRVVGVWPAGITARRDGIDDRSKPHYLAFNQAWHVQAFYPPPANYRSKAA